jgi:hypothetical protein
MSELILDAYEKFGDTKAKNISEIVKIDKEVRAYVQ